MSVYSCTLLNDLVDVPVRTRELEDADIKGDEIALDRVVAHISERKNELHGSWFEEIVLAVP